MRLYADVNQTRKHVVDGQRIFSGFTSVIRVLVVLPFSSRGVKGKTFPRTGLLSQFLVFVNLNSYFFLNLAQHFKNLSRVFNFGKVTHLSDRLRKQSFLLLIELLLVNLKVNKLVTSKFLVLKKLRQFNLTLPFYIRLDYFNSLRVFKPIKLHYKIENFAVI